MIDADGKRIVYAKGQIYVMDADGRNSEQLTHDVGFKRMPSWPPDGRSIAYLANHRIWVMDSNGKNERRLTNINSDEHPTWSPDSESIAFHSIVRDFVWGIYVVDVTSGAVDTLLRTCLKIRKRSRFWSFVENFLMLLLLSAVCLWDLYQDLLWELYRTRYSLT